MRGGCSLIEEFLLKGKLVPNDRPCDTKLQNTWFGQSVAWCPDGGLLAVGAPVHESCDSYDEPLFDNTGAVYIYKKDGGSGTVCDAYVTKLVPNDRPCDTRLTDTYFGWSVAWCPTGGLLAVGAPFHDSCDSDPEDTGAVYIYKKDDDSGTVCDTYVTKLVPNDRPCDTNPQNTWFGYSVAWCPTGGLLAVGAPTHDSCDEKPFDNTGAVYIYKKNVDSGSVCDAYVTKLVPNDRPCDTKLQNTWFGRSVAWSPTGGLLAVGAPTHDSCDSDPDDTGAVYIYKKNGGSGTVCDAYVTKLVPNDRPCDANLKDTKFGESVAWCPDGGLLAVGAPFHDSCDSDPENTGAVYIYKKDGGSGTVCDAYVTKLVPNDRPCYANLKDTKFGESVAWSPTGGLLAVGAPFHDSCDSDPENTGAVYIYKKDGGSGTVCDAYVTKLVPNDRPCDTRLTDTKFGESVAWCPDGGLLAVGAPYHDSCDSDPENTGAVYIYEDKKTII